MSRQPSLPSLTNRGNLVRTSRLTRAHNSTQPLQLSPLQQPRAPESTEGVALSQQPQATHLRGLLTSPASSEMPIWRAWRRSPGDVLCARSVRGGSAQIGRYGAAKGCVCECRPALTPCWDGNYWPMGWVAPRLVSADHSRCCLRAGSLKGGRATSSLPAMGVCQSLSGGANR
jgi:hypothetical protein